MKQRKEFADKTDERALRWKDLLELCQQNDEGVCPSLDGIKGHPV